MTEAGQGQGRGKGGGGNKTKTARKTGRAQLHRAAQRQVGKNSDKLAKVLMDKALAGDLNSAKLLLVLTDPEKTAEESRTMGPPGPMMAEMLAKEPEWGELSKEERRRILREVGRWPPEDEDEYRDLMDDGEQGAGNGDSRDR